MLWIQIALGIVMAFLVIVFLVVMVFEFDSIVEKRKNKKIWGRGYE